MIGFERFEVIGFWVMVGKLVQLMYDSLLEGISAQIKVRLAVWDMATVEREEE